jgi:hypothetical protein
MLARDDGHRMCDSVTALTDERLCFDDQSQSLRRGKKCPGGLIEADTRTIEERTASANLVGRSSEDPRASLQAHDAPKELFVNPAATSRIS